MASDEWSVEFHDLDEVQLVDTIGSQAWVLPDQGVTVEQIRPGAIQRREFVLARAAPGDLGQESVELVASGHHAYGRIENTTHQWTLQLSVVGVERR